MAPNEKYSDKEELEELAPTLFGIEKKHLGKTPDGYFDELPNRIQDAIAEKDNGLWSRVSLFFFNKRSISFAIPAIAVFFGIYWGITQLENQNMTASNDIYESDFVDVEELTVSEVIDEFTAFTIEEEEISLLDFEIEKDLLAALDNDIFFDDFYEAVDKKTPPTSAEDVMEFEDLENYFTSNSFDLDPDFEINKQL
jgi:hypothetical protein